MFTRRRIWILLACSLAIAFGIWAYYSQREPTYEGRTLSSWLTEYESDRNQDKIAAQQLPAANAVRQIGTNALPTLVEWTRYNVTCVLKVHRVARKIGIRNSCNNYFKRKQAQTQLALAGFEILGTNAAPAIPDLVTLATTNNPSNTTFFDLTSNLAVKALHQIGRPGAIALASILKNPAAPNRTWIPVLLVDNTNVDISVPVLVECLKDSDPEVRRNAKITLMRIAPKNTNATISVPVLVEFLKDSDPFVSGNAKTTLMRIAPEQLTNAVPQ